MAYWAAHPEALKLQPQTQLKDGFAAADTPKAARLLMCGITVDANANGCPRLMDDRCQRTR